MSRSVRLPFLLPLILLPLVLSLFSPASAKPPFVPEPPLRPAASFVTAEQLASAVPRSLTPPAPAVAKQALEIDEALAVRLASARARWQLDSDDFTLLGVVYLVAPDGAPAAWDVDFALADGTDFSVTVSATWDAPPVRAARAFASNFVHTAGRLATIADDLLGTAGAELVRVYPCGSWPRAYEFRGDGRGVVIEGQEPWRFWDADTWRDAAVKRMQWKEARAEQSALTQNTPITLAEASVRTANQDLAQQWLQGSVPARSDVYVDQLSACEPFFWWGGCSPTSGGMILNYWDRRDEGGLGVGQLNRWYSRSTSPVTGTDNCRVPELIPLLRTLMHTDNDGETSIFDIRPGMLAHVEQRGYCDGGGPDWLGEFTDWHWDGMVNQLNLSRPFVWSCDFYPGADTGHSVAVVGYESSAQDLICYNTWWDGNVREYAHHSGGVSDWSSIDGVTPSCYESGADLRILSPLGESGWVTDAPCDPLGDYNAACIPITWHNSLSYLNDVEIYYSFDSGANWTLAATTADDGLYEWHPPTWPHDETRIRIDRISYYGGPARVIAGDGTPGNFRVSPPPPQPCLVAVDTLHFTATAYGSIEMQYFHVENFGCEMVNTVPVIVGSDAFEVTEPSLYLEHGWEDYIHVWYRPLCGDDQATLLFPGATCASVVLVGDGPDVPVCDLAPQQLDMPFDKLGVPVTATFTLRNLQCGSLAGNLVSDDPDFSVTPPSYSLAHEESVQVTVTFTPSDCMPDTCHISTGSLCQDVVCYAQDVVTAGSWEAVTSGPLGGTATAFGVIAGDYDQDGDDDLYLTRYGEPNVLLRNDGGLVFTDVTSGPLGDAGAGFSAAWGDCDNDGDLDLYVANQGEADLLLRNDGNDSFTKLTGGGLGTVDPSGGVSWVDIDGDGDLDLYVVCVQTPNLVLRNDGGAGFTRITSLPLADAGYGTDAAWADWDDDGDPDLYLTNYGESDRLLRNDGNWVFTQFDNGPYSYDASSGLAAAWGDVDGDEDLDLVLGKISLPDILYYTGADHRLTPDLTSPLGGSTSTTSLSLVDADLDGDLDLFQFLHADPNCLLRHDGGSTWTDATDGPLSDASMGYGQAWGDFDNDGRADVYLNNADSPNLLCHNEAADTSCRNWLQVDLRGVQSNRFGVGARITVCAGGRRIVREVGAGQGGVNQNALTAHFGLGTATRVDSILVRWPWRDTQVLHDLPPNCRLLIVEGSDATAVQDPTLPRSDLPVALVLQSAIPNPFNPRTQIPFDLPRAGTVTLKIYDATGRLVQTLIAGEYLTPGRHRVPWDGRDRSGQQVGSGVYYCRLLVGQKARMSKLVLLK